MYNKKVLVGVAWAGIVLLRVAWAGSGPAAQAVLQRGYDPGVSGATLAETQLSTLNVTPTTFGLVEKLPVDDNVYAQPLYVPNVVIPKRGTYNVVYIATMSDTLYAFDADAGSAPLWSANFASRVGATPVSMADFEFGGNRNIVGNLGILSTPVIDQATHILYLVACTLEHGTLAYRLHAVDITTGAEPYGPGMLITGSYRGATFDARYQTQRVSLTLAAGQIVFGFAAVEFEYSGGYVGWVMAYDKHTLQQSGIFATVTTGNHGGGVWQSGRPAAVDSAGYVYVFVGNAYGNGYDGVHNFSESVLKLDPAHGLQLVDWFTPGNWSKLDTEDLDLTSSGPLLIPGTNLLAGGGKTGDFYLLNTANLGKFDANDSQVVQKERISASEIRGGPVYWNRSAPNGGPLLYNWGVADWVKAYPFRGGQIAAAPIARGSGTQIFPGGILAMSADGDQPGSGVLWATIATSGDAENNPPVTGELLAFDAADVSRELWSSTTNKTRDDFGNFAKFVPPLVANGKVYVATSSKQVVVYGLLLHTLTLKHGGAGSGIVTSKPAGINCASTCSAKFVSGSAITLAAAAGANSALAGWSGCKPAGNSCTVSSLMSAYTVTATFTIPVYTITITRPNAAGVVTSNVGNIDCGPTASETACSAAFNSGTSIKLTASAQAGHTFVSWGGACSGSSPSCALTMGWSHTVSATFK